MLDDGRWEQLSHESRQSEVQGWHQQRQVTDDQSLQKAMALIQDGELSHAARDPQSLALAPGKETILPKWRNERLRPPEPVEPISTFVGSCSPIAPVVLDKQIFADVLLFTRRGLSSGTEVTGTSA